MRVQDIVIGRRDGFFRRGFRFFLFLVGMSVSFLFIVRR
jgi:hypothetical protein